MKKYLKIGFIWLLPLLFPLLMVFGNQASEGIQCGLQLAYQSVLPALFPSAVVCGMLAELLEYLPLSPNRALWITAQLCGFPLGIKSLCRAHQRELIDRKTAIALSACSANASPAFLILYVGGKLFGNIKIGVLLFLGQVFISFSIALFNGALRSCPKALPPEQSLFSVWGGSIGNATSGCLILTGYICLFSAVAAIMNGFSLFRFVYGFLELTGGIAKVLPDELFLCSSMVGFSGISVLLQNASFLAQARLPIRPMIYSKIIYGLSLPLFIYIMISKDGFLFLFLIFLFMISFDKYRKTRYNKLNDQKMLRRLP